MLTFNGTSIRQELDGVVKDWLPVELLETYNPLVGESLAARNRAMKEILWAAEEQYDELSETALLRYHFWKLLLPQRVESQTYHYTITIGDTCQWELTVNPEGVIYKDLTPMYSSSAGAVHEQLFSDFWFYGPLMPIPDLHIRKQVLARIRNAFVQVAPPAYQQFTSNNSTAATTPPYAFR